MTLLENEEQLTPSRQDSKLGALLKSSHLNSLNDSTLIPTTTDCIAHLEFLKAVSLLRSEVRKWANSWGISRDNAWDVFVKLSTARFLFWVDNAHLEKHQSMIPTDILMVWHAFMLNPADYSRFQDSENFAYGDIGFNWQELKLKWHSTPNSHNSSPSSLSNIFKTRIHYDLLNFLNSEFARTSSTKNFILFPKIHHKTFNLSKRRDTDEETYNLFLAYDKLAQNNFLYVNGSFSFDIPSAVHRQVLFTERMNGHGWLHAPFTLSAIERAKTRYSSFFQLAAEFQFLVPTLDIDLVWHTHMLSPSRYREFCLHQTGKMIYHDDKKGKKGSHVNEKDFEIVWEKRFGSSYVVCLCWLCQLSRDETNCSDRKTPFEALLKEKARRIHTSVSGEVEFIMPGCDDCGNHPDTNCETLTIEYAVQPLDTNCAYTYNENYGVDGYDDDNTCSCDYCEKDGDCECNGCENPQCYCLKGQTCCSGMNAEG